MFRDVENVQDPGAAAIANQAVGMLNQSGLRLGMGPTGRRVYFGTELATPQRFTRAAEPINGPEQIEAAVITGSTAARSVNKTRGRVELLMGGGR